MKRAIITLGLILFSLISYSQNMGKDSTSVARKVIELKSSSPKETKTEYDIEIKGVKYPLYQGARGGYYIKRVSKNGNPYKKYFKKEDLGLE